MIDQRQCSKCKGLFDEDIFLTKTGKLSPLCRRCANARLDTLNANKRAQRDKQWDANLKRDFFVPGLVEAKTKTEELIAYAKALGAAEFKSTLFGASMRGKQASILAAKLRTCIEAVKSEIPNV